MSEQERIQEDRCSCGALLTAEEIRYYGISCERCEKEWLQNMLRSGVPLPDSLRCPTKILARGEKLEQLMAQGAFVLASQVLGLQQKLHVAEDAYSQSFATVYRLGSAIVEVKQEREKWKERAEKIDETCHKFMAELEQADAERAQLRSDLAAAQAELDESREQVSERGAAINALCRDIEQYKTEIEAAREQYIDAMAMAVKFEHELSAAQSALFLAQDQNRASELVFFNLKADLAALTPTTSSAGWVEQAYARLGFLQDHMRLSDVVAVQNFLGPLPSPPPKGDAG